MNKNDSIRFTALFISFALLISMLGCSPKNSSSGDGNLNKSAKQMSFFNENSFNFAIVRSATADTDLVTYIKENVFKKARAITEKRPAYVTDDNLPSGDFKGIYIGSTSAEISKSAEKKFEEKGPLYYSYQIMELNGNISIFGASNEAIELGMKYFCDNILKDKNSSISENYYYYCDTKESKSLYVNNVDISKYIIRCDKYPSGMVYRGCQELKKAINDFSEYDIPIVCGKETKGFDNYKNIIDVTIGGEDYKAYSVKVNGDNINIVGGQDYSVNAALHTFAQNINNVKKGKRINIKSDFELHGSYNDKTLGSDGYKLMFSEDFDGNSLNKNIWYFDEYVSYRGTDHATVNVSDSYAVENGILKQISKNISLPDGTMGWTGNKMRAKKWFTYGYFEARIKMPKGHGNFSAFWSRGKRTDTKPYAPEIDVYECGINPVRTTANLHSWWKYSDFMGNLVATDSQRASGHRWHIINEGIVDLRKDASRNPYYLQNGEDFADDYHTFGCEWTPTFITLYIDGHEIYSVDITSNLKDPEKGFPVSEYALFTDGQPMELCINSGLTVGSEEEILAGNVVPVDETAIIPSIVEVDWVRLYQMDGVGKISDEYYED